METGFEMKRTLNIHKVKNQKMCLKLEKSMWRELFGKKIKGSHDN
jgi:hypothetical protein